MADSLPADVSGSPGRASRRPGRTRIAVYAIILIFAGIGAAFVVGEIAVRATGLAPPSFYTYDPYLGWAMKPGAAGWQEEEGRAYVRVNRAGFRGPDYTVAKPPDTLRIAVLGDSVVEAQQVPYEDTFCAVMQRELTAQSPRQMRVEGGVKTFNRVEVMNFGCDGYGTAQELITLQRRVWRYSPDIVVLSFFTGNDVRNNSVVLEGDKCRPFYVYRDGKLALGGPFEDSRMFHFHCMLRFESRHSQLLNVLGSGVSVLRQRIREAFRRAHSKPEATGSNQVVAKKVQPTGVEPGISDLIYRPPSTPVWRDAWRVTDGEIEMMNRDVKAHGATLLVVTMTNGTQVNPDVRLRDAYMKWVGVSDLFYPDDRTKELGERDGFAVLNLARPLQAYADQHHVYLHGFQNTHFGSGHWNPEGHRLAGELIANKVLELLDGDGAANTPAAASAAMHH